MPPFQSRSTGAFSTARISSGGESAGTLPSMPSAVRISGVSGIDFFVREKTPPPGEIRLRS